MHFFKKILILGIICTIGYFILAYHYIIMDAWYAPKMLKKEKLTLKYTIYNTKGKRPEKVMDIQELWDDGIGELLLKEGKISKKQLDNYKMKKEAEEAEE